MITFDDFTKLDIRVAKIKAAEVVEGTDKLLKLTLDVGELGERIVASGIKPWYEPEKLVGKEVVYLANLESKTIKGIESQGMILAAGEENCTLLIPDQNIAPGTKVH